MTNTSFNLNNKLAIITGGGTGIGLGIAKSMLTAGAKVIIVGRRKEILKEAVEELGKNASFEVQDIGVLNEIPAFVEKIESKYGPIDILVNNAGIHKKAWAVDTNDADFMNILHTNIASVFALSREVAIKMKTRKSGSILMISSMAGLFGIDRVAAYGTSKTAIIGLMNALVTEWSVDNIRINTIAPGWIASPMFFNAVNADPDRKAKIVNRIAMDGFGTPEDIGNAAVFLSSAAARYITGVVLPVDGGASVNF